MVNYSQGWIGNRTYRAFLVGRQNVLNKFFAKDHHAGTASSQWLSGRKITVPFFSEERPLVTIVRSPYTHILSKIITDS